jgi:hypothetical protein
MLLLALPLFLLLFAPFLVLPLLRELLLFCRWLWYRTLSYVLGVQLQNVLPPSS